MKKKLITLALAPVLCFAMCPAVHAASGDLSVSALVAGNMTVSFSSETKQVLGPNATTNNAYFKYAMLPSGNNLSSVTTIFTYTGKALKINGTTVASYNTVSQRTYTHSEDFTGVLTVEVVYGNTSKVYYVAAYLSTFDVSMSFEYENARTFSTLQGDTYGTSGMLDQVTSAQKATATSAVSAMDTMCNSMSPDITSTQYKSLENIQISPNSMVTDSNTVYGLLCTFQSARTNFTFTTNPDSSYHQIVDIGALGPNSTGQSYGYGSGGWMYQVIRGGVTFTPLVGTSEWMLFPGDEVVWRYTCDYGYDIGCPLW